MTKLYVDAINDPNSIPNVQTAWETHVQRKCKDAKRKAMQAYDKKIKEQLSKLPCDGEKILASHESAIRQSMAIFNDETAGISSDHTKRDSDELMVRKFPLFSPAFFLPSFLPRFFISLPPLHAALLSCLHISLLPSVLISLPFDYLASFFCSLLLALTSLHRKAGVLVIRLCRFFNRMKEFKSSLNGKPRTIV